MEYGNSTTTRLLTLLNISATRTENFNPSFEPSEPSIKLNKRRPVQTTDGPISEKENASSTDRLDAGLAMDLISTDAGKESPFITSTSPNGNPKDQINFYERQFGVCPVALTKSTMETVERQVWHISKAKRGKVGHTVEAVPQEIHAISYQPSIESVSVIALDVDRTLIEKERKLAS